MNFYHRLLWTYWMNRDNRSMKRQTDERTDRRMGGWTDSLLYGYRDG